MRITPFKNHPGGAASDFGRSLSEVITPKYIESLPPPYLADYFEFPPGVKYDDESKLHMAQPIPEDVFFAAGPPGVILVSRPWAYDTDTGHIYMCNGNQDTVGNFFYDW